MGTLISCADCCHLLISPAWQEELEEKGKKWGPMLAGALFGAGWWFWVDAVANTSHKVPFVQYLPGIVATLALVMINLVKRDEMDDYDPFDSDGNICRSRTWLFICYVISFGAVIGSVWILMQDYALKKGTPGAELWPGVAGVFQVALVLLSGLVLFMTRGQGYDNGYMSF